MATEITNTQQSTNFDNATSRIVSTPEVLRPTARVIADLYRQLGTADACQDLVIALRNQIRENTSDSSFPIPTSGAQALADEYFVYRDLLVDIENNYIVADSTNTASIRTLDTIIVNSQLDFHNTEYSAFDGYMSARRDTLQDGTYNQWLGTPVGEIPADTEGEYQFINVVGFAEQANRLDVEEAYDISSHRRGYMNLGYLYGLVSDIVYRPYLSLLFAERDILDLTITFDNPSSYAVSFTIYTIERMENGQISPLNRVLTLQSNNNFTRTLRRLNRSSVLYLGIEINQWSIPNSHAIIRKFDSDITGEYKNREIIDLGITESIADELAIRGGVSSNELSLNLWHEKQSTYENARSRIGLNKRISPFMIAQGASDYRLNFGDYFVVDYNTNDKLKTLNIIAQDATSLMESYIYNDSRLAVDIEDVIRGDDIIAMQYTRRQIPPTPGTEEYERARSAGATPLWNSYKPDTPPITTPALSSPARGFYAFDQYITPERKNFTAYHVVSGGKRRGIVCRNERDFITVFEGQSVYRPGHNMDDYTDISRYTPIEQFTPLSSRSAAGNSVLEIDTFIVAVPIVQAGTQIEFTAFTHYNGQSIQVPENFDRQLTPNITEVTYDGVTYTVRRFRIEHILTDSGLTQRTGKHITIQLNRSVRTLDTGQIYQQLNFFPAMTSPRPEDYMTEANINAWHNYTSARRRIRMGRPLDTDQERIDGVNADLMRIRYFTVTSSPEELRRVPNDIPKIFLTVGGITVEAETDNVALQGTLIHMGALVPPTVHQQESVRLQLPALVAPTASYMQSARTRSFIASDGRRRTVTITDNSTPAYYTHVSAVMNVQEQAIDAQTSRASRIGYLTTAINRVTTTDDEGVGPIYLSSLEYYKNFTSSHYYDYSFQKSGTAIDDSTLTSEIQDGSTTLADITWSRQKREVRTYERNDTVYFGHSANSIREFNMRGRLKDMIFDAARGNPQAIEEINRIRTSINRQQGAYLEFTNGILELTKGAPNREMVYQAFLEDTSNMQDSIQILAETITLRLSFLTTQRDDRDRFVRFEAGEDRLLFYSALPQVSGLSLRESDGNTSVTVQRAREGRDNNTRYSIGLIRRVGDTNLANRLENLPSNRYAEFTPYADDDRTRSIRSIRYIEDSRDIGPDRYAVVTFNYLDEQGTVVDFVQSFIVTHIFSNVNENIGTSPVLIGGNNIPISFYRQDRFQILSPIIEFPFALLENFTAESPARVDDDYEPFQPINSITPIQPSAYDRLIEDFTSYYIFPDIFRTFRDNDAYAIRGLTVYIDQYWVPDIADADGFTYTRESADIPGYAHTTLNNGNSNTDAFTTIVNRTTGRIKGRQYAINTVLPENHEPVRSFEVFSQGTYFDIHDVLRAIVNDAPKTGKIYIRIRYETSLDAPLVDNFIYFRFRKAITLKNMASELLASFKRRTGHVTGDYYVHDAYKYTEVANPFVESVEYRSALSNIVQMIGGYAYSDRDGNIVVDGRLLPSNELVLPQSEIRAYTPRNVMEIGNVNHQMRLYNTVVTNINRPSLPLIKTLLTGFVIRTNKRYVNALKRNVVDREARIREPIYPANNPWYIWLAEQVHAPIRYINAEGGSVLSGQGIAYTREVQDNGEVKFNDAPLFNPGRDTDSSIRTIIDEQFNAADDGLLSFDEYYESLIEADIQRQQDEITEDAYRIERLMAALGLLDVIGETEITVEAGEAKNITIDYDDQPVVFLSSVPDGTPYAGVYVIEGKYDNQREQRLYIPSSQFFVGSTGELQGGVNTNTIYVNFSQQQFEITLPGSDVRLVGNSVQDDRSGTSSIQVINPVDRAFEGTIKLYGIAFDTISKEPLRVSLPGRTAIESDKELVIDNPLIQSASIGQFITNLMLNRIRRNAQILELDIKPDPDTRIMETVSVETIPRIANAELSPQQAQAQLAELDRMISALETEASSTGVLTAEYNRLVSRRRELLRAVHGARYRIISQEITVSEGTFSQKIRLVQ